MKFLKLGEMIAVMPGAFGARDDLETELVRESVRAYPDLMRRIYDFAYLTQTSLATKEFVSSEIDGRLVTAYLAGGEDGIRALDSALMDIFQSGAPREIFDVPGRATDKRLEGEILLRLLWERSKVGLSADCLIHDPVKFERTIITNPERKLVVALSRWLAKDDSELARQITHMGLMDRDPHIRTGVLRAGSWMIGHRDVLAAVGGLRGDSQKEIRLEAVQALAVHVDIPAVAQEILSFQNDSNHEVREAILGAFASQAGLDDETVESLMNFAFDIDYRVEDAARRVIPHAAIVNHLKGIALEMCAGFSPSRAEMVRVASSDILSTEEREEAFLTLIEILTDHGEPALATLHEVVISLGAWSGEHSARFWQGIADNRTIFSHSDFVRAFPAIIRKGFRGPEAMPLLNTLIRLEQFNERPSHLVIGFFSEWVPMAKERPFLLDWLLGLCLDKSFSVSMREVAIHSMHLFGPSKRIAEAFEAMFLDPGEAPVLAKQALMTAQKSIGGQAERTALFERALASPFENVTQYAKAALTAAADDFRTQQSASSEVMQKEIPPGPGAKVIDLDRARQRAKARSKIKDTKDKS